MKIKIITPDKRKINLRFPNCIVLNRCSFGLIKCAVKHNAPQIRRLKYKHIKSVIKIIKGYQGREKYCFLEVCTAQNAEIRMFI